MESWISVSIVILGIMMRACVHLIGGLKDNWNSLSVET